VEKPRIRGAFLHERLLKPPRRCVEKVSSSPRVGAGFAAGHMPKQRCQNKE
jgi:hypothetical protein